MSCALPTWSPCGNRHLQHVEVPFSCREPIARWWWRGVGWAAGFGGGGGVSSAPSTPRAAPPVRPDTGLSRLAAFGCSWERRLVPIRCCGFD